MNLWGSRNRPCEEGGVMWFSRRELREEMRYRKLFEELCRTRENMIRSLPSVKISFQFYRVKNRSK